MLDAGHRTSADGALGRPGGEKALPDAGKLCTEREPLTTGTVPVLSPAGPA